MMYGWNGFFAGLAGGSGLVHSILTWSAVLLTVAAVVWTWLSSWDSASPAFLLRIAIALAGTMLINAHFYRQDMTLAVPALAFGGAYWRLTNGGWGWWPGIAAAFWAADGLGFTLLIEYGINVQTPALALLFLALIYTLQSHHRRIVTDDREVRAGLALAA